MNVEIWRGVGVQANNVHSFSPRTGHFINKQTTIPFGFGMQEGAREGRRRKREGGWGVKESDGDPGER